MTDELMAQAEANIQLLEDSGLPYQTITEKKAATLQVYEQLKRQSRQEQIPEAASASEGGNVVGATDDLDHAAIAAEIERLRQGPATAESMAKRKELRGKLDIAMGDVDVKFDAN